LKIDDLAGDRRRKKPTKSQSQTHFEASIDILEISQFLHTLIPLSIKQYSSIMSTTLSNAALRSSSSIVAKSSKNALLGSTRTMAGGKEIRFGVEGRAAMLRGVDLMADAVQVGDIVYITLYDDIYY